MKTHTCEIVFNADTNDPHVWDLAAEYVEGAFTSVRLFGELKAQEKIGGTYGTAVYIIDGVEFNGVREALDHVGKIEVGATEWFAHNS